MNPLQILYQLAREGHRLELMGDVLRVTGHAALSEEERRLIKKNKERIVALLSQGGGQHKGQTVSAVSAHAVGSGLDPERALPDNARCPHGHVEFAALPFQWRHGLARFAQAEPRPDFRAGRWRRAVTAAGQILETIAVPAFVMGWTAEDLFGVHKTHPADRIDAQGLMFLIRDGHLIEGFTEKGDAIVLVNSTGSRLRYRRSAPNPDQVPIWNVLTSHNRGEGLA